MKTRTQVAKRLGLVGAGIGLTLFALFGLLQGSLIGGAIGLDIVNSLYSTAAEPTLFARVIIGASMLAGVIVTGILFVVFFSIAGWSAGYVVGWMAEPKAEATAYQETKSKTN